MSSYEMVCSGCGERHGLAPSVMRKWHKCNTCGSYYCPDCADNLEEAGWFSWGTERFCHKCGARPESSDLHLILKP